MNLDKRLIIIMLVTLTTTGCDQGTKYLAGSYLPRYEMTSYFYDSVRIGYIENTGDFLGFGDILPEDLRFLLFTVVVGVFLIPLLLYLFFNSTLNTLSVIGYSLIFGGGVSNLHDRITNAGAVVDFLNPGIGTIRTGIFNIADMAIMTGETLALLAHSRIWRTLGDR